MLIEADHVMPGLSWSKVQDAEAEVASKRHQDRSNYGFVNGHAEARRLPTVFDPAQGVDFLLPGGIR